MLFRKDIEPRCAYCTQGVCINETQVACVKKGIVAAENHCFRFRYDPPEAGTAPSGPAGHRRAERGRFQPIKPTKIHKRGEIS